MSDWLDVLRALPPERLFVSHKPDAPRIGRVENLLPYLLRHGLFIGVATDDTGEHTVATWAPHPEGGRLPGYYACFRILYWQRDYAAQIALFYDGNDGSPRITSASAARAFASRNGFTVQP